MTEEKKLVSGQNFDSAKRWLLPCLCVGGCVCACGCNQRLDGSRVKERKHFQEGKTERSEGGERRESAFFLFCCFFCILGCVVVFTAKKKKNTQSRLCLSSGTSRETCVVLFFAFN